MMTPRNTIISAKILTIPENTYSSLAKYVGLSTPHFCHLHTKKPLKCISEASCDVLSQNQDTITTALKQWPHAPYRLRFPV